MLATYALALVAIATPFTQETQEQGEVQNWQAGFAAVEITPTFPVGMAGYGGRLHQASEKLIPLFAKACVLKDARGNTSVLVTLDLVGIHRDQSLRLRSELAQLLDTDPASVMIACSHTHTGPIVGRNLGAMHYWTLDQQQQAAVDRYEQELDRKIIEVVGQAREKVTPVELRSGIGACDFAVNRRNNPEAEVPERRTQATLLGPVDHRVPVLAAYDSQGQVQGIVFGYACHATVLSSNEWSGDYPGYAQAALETRFPGATAMFWAGCGADQNPLPRRTVALARHYGDRLADSVEAVLLTQSLSRIAPSLSATQATVELEIDAETRVEAWQQLVSSDDRFVRGRAQYVLESLDETGSVPTRYPYPVAIWRLGEVSNQEPATDHTITWVFLGGEVVVDYSLRLREWEDPSTESVWVTAYANDVMAYIPSRRVLGEGGYEGGGAMLYYGLPGVWKETVEEAIFQTLAKIRSDQPIAH